MTMITMLILRQAHKFQPQRLLMLQEGGSTLITALEAIGLDSTLCDTSNKFTVFEPTD